MTGFQIATSRGHGLGGLNNWEYDSLPPEALDWVHKMHEKLDATLSKPMADVRLIHGTIFPSFSLLWNRFNIRVFHPKGPGEMEAWSWGLVPRNAPQRVRREIMLDYQRHFSPAGTWEQDDGEQWAFCARGEGFMSSSVRLNYGMGAAREARSVVGLPGMVDDVFSEINQRSFYRRWSELMATPHRNERVQLVGEGQVR